MEHRWGIRIPVDIPVRIVRRPYVLRPGRIVNLSVSGAAIEADHEIKSLAQIEILIDLPHCARSAVPSLHAYVTRSGNDEIGVEWCDYAPPIIGELLQMVSIRRFSPLRRLTTPAPFVATIGSAPYSSAGHRLACHAVGRV